MSSFVHSRLRACFLRIAALTCAGLFASAGVALASCPDQSLTTPFAQWGDTNSYFMIPGGSFEGTSDQVGWTLSGASLTPGNEPFYVNSSGDSQSLTISAGGTATSPFFCVDNTMSDLRFFEGKIRASHHEGLSFEVARVSHSSGSRPSGIEKEKLARCFGAELGRIALIGCRGATPVTTEASRNAECGSTRLCSST